VKVEVRKKRYKKVNITKGLGRDNLRPKKIERNEKKKETYHKKKPLRQRKR